MTFSNDLYDLKEHLKQAQLIANDLQFRVDNPEWEELLNSGTIWDVQKFLVMYRFVQSGRDAVATADGLSISTRTLYDWFSVWGILKADGTPYKPRPGYRGIRGAGKKAG